MSLIELIISFPTRSNVGTEEALSRSVPQCFVHARQLSIFNLSGLIMLFFVDVSLNGSAVTHHLWKFSP